MIVELFFPAIIILIWIFNVRGWITEDNGDLKWLGVVMVAILISSIFTTFATWCCSGRKGHYLFEHIDTIPVLSSEGGEVKHFFTYEEEAHKAPLGAKSQDSIWVYKGHHQKNRIYSIFESSDKIYFSLGEDKFLQASQGIDLRQEQ